MSKKKTKKIPGVTKMFYAMEDIIAASVSNNKQVKKKAKKKAKKK